jgi:hypothetical protein
MDRHRDLKSYSRIVITPVYEDREASSRLFQEIRSQFGNSVFTVAIDDGSVRSPLTAGDLAGAPGLVLRLRRNVGHQRAIAIGLAYVADTLAEWQQVVIMDSDGEDVPATIPILLEALKDPEVDVAVSHRKSRVETLRFKAFYTVYKAFFRIMTGRRISFGNFMALKASAVRRLVCMHELPIHVAGAVLASRLRIRMCPIDRGPRYAGKSKMNFVGLALHGFKGLMIFAEDVLVRVGIICAITAAASVLGAIIATVLKFIGLSTPGWYSVAFGIMMLMFMQTGTLALMTLMLTGIVRGGAVITRAAHLDYIEEVLMAEAKDVRRSLKKP